MDRVRADRVQPPPVRSLLAQVDRLGVLQMDAVNVLARAHYLPLFSRLGAYATASLDDAAYGKSRRLFEYWGHMASLLPVAMQPLFRWRMAEAERLEGWGAGIAREKRGYVDDVLAEVRRRGPVRASEIASPQGRSGAWWGWSDAKSALEWLFRAGLVTTSGRRGFERLYDVTERVLPRAVLSTRTPSVEDAHRELVRLSARALGIGTDDDLADYFRLRLGAARPRIAELVEAGELIPTSVEGIAKPMFRARGARSPRAVRASTLLSPFDPLVWHRPRAERLFGFHYRIGIYTPEHLRDHGYYVLPFLLGDRVVARLDLKADRQARVLRVPASHLEAGATARAVLPAIAAELRHLARWLGLDAIEVERRGDLGSPLRKVMAAKAA